jgi:catechol 2,3-dioxygenase-like lactoylglutathione lyase family enzyme
METTKSVKESVDMKLEVVVLGVSDVDRAKAFYENLGWRLDADFARGDDFRVVQLTPLFAKSIERHALRRIMR